MKKLLLVFLIVISSFSFAKENPYKFIMSGNSSGKMDINHVTQEEMLKAGVAQSYIRKIISYRDVKGNIENIEELERISGIGKKTCKKLEKYFIIDRIPKINHLYINKADNKTLRYYGFSKKEIKKIRNHLNKNGKIRSSITLKKVISKSKYEKYKDIIEFDSY